MLRISKCVSGFVTLAALCSACSRSSEGPTTPVQSASEPASPPYPATPTAPPPVTPPPGKGLGVKVQRYIVVDQFGYRPDMRKVAVLVDPRRGWNAGDSYSPGKRLELRRWSDGELVFSDSITPWNGGKVDESAGDAGAWFDFSTVEAPGLYYVFDPDNAVRSYPFQIAPDVYDRVLKTALRVFYFNRANFEKKAPFACVGQRCWTQGVDNLGPGQDSEARSVRAQGDAKTARDLRGGWWDAGDTNKYVTFSNDAVHQLLTAYQERPGVFGDDFGIPESGNGLPDLLDEIEVELEWLKRMQPSDLDGGVLLKMGNVEYGDPLPEQSKLQRFYYPEPCSAATIVLAGELAHAALVFGQIPRLVDYANDLRRRAEKAWVHFHAHDKSDSCDDGTIKAGDADRTLGEQAQIAVTAAAYLFGLTAKSEYGAYVVQHHAVTRPFVDDRWSVYDQSQGDALLYYASLPGADAATKQAIIARKKMLGDTLDVYKFRPDFDLYRAFMRPDSYHWGSNNARAGYANTNYDFLQHDLALPVDVPLYRERVAGLLGSFHGVNPMQLVYLTNMYADGGDACADEAYHTWFRDKDPRWDNARTSELGPAPGYVTGGPNKSYCKDQPKEHACTRSPVLAQPPEKAYVDTNTSYEPTNPYDKSWELTEPAIYYQASYVRLLSKFVE